MKKLKRYDLEFESTFKYFNKYLAEINYLSEFVLSLNLSEGSFYTLLPFNVNARKILEFQTGGMTQNLRDEVGVFIQNKLESGDQLSSIFDDFDADIKVLEGNYLYNICGVHYKNQIYYEINQINLSAELVAKSMQYSDAIWHFLCVLTEAKINLHMDKELSLEKIQEICLKANTVVIGAYDGEGYIFWERKTYSES